MIARALALSLLSCALAARADPGAPKLVARCEPPVVERGANVRCALHAEPAMPFLFVARTAVASGHTEKETLHEIHAADEEAAWEGPAVVSTKVMFAARAGSALLHAEARFEVAPRKLPRLTLAEENRSCAIDTQAKQLLDPPELAQGSTTDEPLPAFGALSRARLTLPPPDWTLVDRGPDKNWYFVSALSNEPAKLAITLTRVLEEGAPFRLAQHGDRTLPTREAGLWPHCRKVDLACLRAALWEGEGCAGDAADSRMRRVSALLENGLDVNAAWEKMVLPLDARARENPFVARIESRARELEAQALESPQGKPPDLKLACRLRYQ